MAKDIEVHLIYRVEDADDWRLVENALGSTGPLTVDVEGLPEEWDRD